MTGVTIGIPVADLRAAQRWHEALLEVDAPDLEPVSGDLRDPDGKPTTTTGSPGTPQPPRGPRAGR